MTFWPQTFTVESMAFSLIDASLTPIRLENENAAGPLKGL
jgi:hypothetical protein